MGWQVIFDEPMVTRALILAQADSVMALPGARRHRTAGYYPNAYRIKHDVQAKEYRIALTGLTWQE